MRTVLADMNSLVPGPNLFANLFKPSLGAQLLRTMKSVIPKIERRRTVLAVNVLGASAATAAAALLDHYQM